ncbi:MAG TPA: FHA domain-containing protein [Anaeromyxobacteraceae bacterium]|nr:FHA domain-containing protein [Anaeromyxobacteraceae bacterium]
MLTCKTCGATVGLADETCAACGSEVPLGRLTGFLGVVCRACDAYNDPGARACIACGASLASEAVPAGRAAAVPPGAAAAEPDEDEIEIAAAAAVQARLVVERGDASPGTVFRVEDEVQAGRSQGAIVFPDDPCLAPLHVTFLLRDEALWLRDEGAAGGVFVRLRGLTVPIRPGTLFAVGDRLLRFGGPLPAPPLPGPDGTLRLGGPRPPGAAVLVEEWLEGGIGGRAYVRSGPSITVGRAGCAINLGEDPYLSQAHAELLVEADGSTRLRDLGSSNGTFVRIAPGAERELHDGDAVRLGREVLRVEVG